MGKRAIAARLRLRLSDAQANAEALARRSAPYGAQHAMSERHENDRVSARPTSKRSLLRWAQRLARLDGPLRMHGRDVAGDGAPQMTGETRGYLGMTGGDGPTDWLNVACRLDESGVYVSPLRCAIARIGTSQPRHAALLLELVKEFADEDRAAAAVGIPAEFVDDVVVRSLNLLYDRFGVQPIPRVRPVESPEVAA